MSLLRFVVGILEDFLEEDLLVRARLLVSVKETEGLVGNSKRLNVSV